MADSKRTVIQELSDLVEWFLQDRGVQLRFIPIATQAHASTQGVRYTGKHAPEFAFEYWIDGRRIQDKTLAMLIMTELQRRNYNYNLAKIISALVEHSWRYYVANCEYPEWLITDPPPLKRPIGRPRKHPKPIKFDELEQRLEAPAMAMPVNTGKG
jgi:hypothetical protein